MPWIEAARVDEIDEARPLPKEVNGIAVALMRHGDSVVAVIDRCPHMEFPLSDGRIVDGQLECSAHHWRFDVFDAPDDAVPPEARCTHVPVDVRGGVVYVALDA